MKINRSFGIICAIAVHAGVLLFGGLFFMKHKQDHGTLQQVELFSQEELKQEKLEEPEPEKDPQELETEEEAAPDVAEIIERLETPVVQDAPALEAASLSSIEAALSGQAGSGDFAEALSFSSGGRIGGTGQPGGLNDGLENAFSLSEIDQKPRPIFQTAPVYPASMRSRKVEGVVTVIFVVDPTGKVSNPRVEKSSDSVFESPALSAIKHWKFEPAIRAGQRVACKMRIPIRFQPR